MNQKKVIQRQCSVFIFADQGEREFDINVKK